MYWWHGGFHEPEPGVKLEWPLLRRVFSYFIPYWRLALIVLACIGAAAALGPGPAIVTRGLINYLTRSHGQIWTAARLIGILVCSAGVGRRHAALSGTKGTAGKTLGNDRLHAGDAGDFGYAAGQGVRPAGRRDLSLPPAQRRPARAQHPAVDDRPLVLHADGRARHRRSGCALAVRWLPRRDGPGIAGHGGHLCHRLAGTPLWPGRLTGQHAGQRRGLTRPLPAHLRVHGPAGHDRPEAAGAPSRAGARTSSVRSGDV